MAGKSDYLENAIVDHALGTATFTKPTAVYLGLYSAAPTDAGGGTEISGNGYARQAITFNAASGGSAANSNTPTFTASGGAWAAATHFGIFDAVSGGNLLYWNALTAPKTLANGESVDFLPGDVIVAED